MCVCERERVCVCERERERESVCVCVRERESVCVCVCVPPQTPNSGQEAGAGKRCSECGAA